MWIEVSYRISRELCSQHFPHRKRFHTSDEVEAWCKEMDAQHGELGWTLGDENVYQGEMPVWPRCTKSLWQVYKENEQRYKENAQRRWKDFYRER